MAQRIRYPSLDPSRPEIRVLEVLPADRVEDVAVCRFARVSLDHDVEFVGISSLLGDQLSATEPVFIDGARIDLPENIGQALRYVRAVFPRQAASRMSGASSSSSEPDGNLRKTTSHLPPPSLQNKSPSWLRRLFGGSRPADLTPTNGPQPLRIWMDALCVNPRDAREVKEQRNTMAAAYRRARMVVGWLGPKDRTSDLAIEIIRTLDRCMPADFGSDEDRRLHPEHYSPHHSWMAGMAHLWALAPGESLLESRPYQALAAFFGRTYFRRDWIINEICMATFPAFLVGDEIVSWLEVLRWNRANEEMIDSQSELFPQNYRDAIEQFLPLASVYTLLREWERRKAAGTLQAPGGPPPPQSGFPRKTSVVLRK